MPPLALRLTRGRPMDNPLWDDSDDNDDDLDDTNSGQCHHGVGFDEDCEACNAEFDAGQKRAPSDQGER